MKNSYLDFNPVEQINRWPFQVEQINSNIISDNKLI